MVDRLYGVYHGASNVDSRGNVTNAHKGPITSLKEDLSELPPGTSVGIEFHPDIAREHFVEGRTINFLDSTVYYWQQVEKLCRENGLRIIYLDDIDLSLKSAVYQIESADDYYLGSLSAENVRDDVNYERRAYCNQVIADYILEVAREEKILQRIAEENPDIVLLGKTHGDVLVLCPHILRQAGIEVKSYKTEYLSRDVVYSSNEPETQFLEEREVLCRRYNAITKGRIYPDRQPDYIGYSLDWRFIPEKGLFEIYLDGKEGFSGRLVDVLREGDFEGAIDKEKVEFTEKRPLHELLGGFSEIRYDGTFEKGRYVGKFKSGNRTDNFVLKKYRLGMRLKDYKFVIEKNATI